MLALRTTALLRSLPRVAGAASYCGWGVLLMQPSLPQVSVRKSQLTPHRPQKLPQPASVLHRLSGNSAAPPIRRSPLSDNQEPTCISLCIQIMYMYRVQQARVLLSVIQQIMYIYNEIQLCVLVLLDV